MTRTAADLLAFVEKWGRECGFQSDRKLLEALVTDLRMFLHEPAPVPAPVQGQCVKCSGTGEMEIFDSSGHYTYVTCDECNGAGTFIHRASQFEPPSPPVEGSARKTPREIAEDVLFALRAEENLLDLMDAEDQGWVLGAVEAAIVVDRASAGRGDGTKGEG